MSLASRAPSPSGARDKILLVSHVTEIRAQAGCVDYRRAARGTVTYARGEAPAEIERACLAMMTAYGLPFAAFDLLRCADGSFVFLEMNADGEWQWIEGATGAPMAAAMAELLLEGG
jgi:hypothetical protein